MNAGERKRSITIAGHRTSVSLEDPFWEALGEIASQRGIPIAALVAEIDGSRAGVGLSSAIRMHILAHYRGARAATHDPTA